MVWSAMTIDGDDVGSLDHYPLLLDVKSAEADYSFVASWQCGYLHASGSQMRSSSEHAQYITLKKP